MVKQTRWSNYSSGVRDGLCITYRKICKKYDVANIILKNSKFNISCVLYNILQVAYYTYLSGLWFMKHTGILLHSLHNSVNDCIRYSNRTIINTLPIKNLYMYKMLFEITKLPIINRSLVIVIGTIKLWKNAHVSDEKQEI